MDEISKEDDGDAVNEHEKDANFQQQRLQLEQRYLELVRISIRTMWMERVNGDFAVLAWLMDDGFVVMVSTKGKEMEEVVEEGSMQ